uniref:Uncharacterized protein n=1 Tax=Strigamia maritima TaxID=126957 RepID=T1IW60_STRMM
MAKICSFNNKRRAATPKTPTFVERRCLEIRRGPWVPMVKITIKINNNYSTVGNYCQYLNSLNYNITIHIGVKSFLASTTVINCYGHGVPAGFSKHLRQAMKQVVPEYSKHNAIWLSSDSAMVPPTILEAPITKEEKPIADSLYQCSIFPKDFRCTPEYKVPLSSTLNEKSFPCAYYPGLLAMSNPTLMAQLQAQAQAQAQQAHQCIL